jgi:hypothetical protein
MTVNVYRSTDPGAPTLSGVAGTFNNVLNACLVAGYGNQAGAGWSRPFTGTNVSVYRQPATANQRYLSVDETTTDGLINLRGYENMTAVSTGTGVFPLPTQPVVNLYRGSNGDATAHPWFCVATDKMIYFWNSSSASSPSNGMYGFAFGDFISTVPNDQYNTILIGHGNSSGSNYGMPFISATAIGGSALNGHYVVRNYTQTGGAIMVSKVSDWAKIGNSAVGQSGMPFPSPADGKIYVAPFYIMELVGSSNGILRGTLPGIWAPCFAAAVVMSDGDRLSSIDGLPGKTLELKCMAHGSTTWTGLLYETSNTW